MSTRVNLSCSSVRKRRRFVVATGSPAASEFRRCCLLLLTPYDRDSMDMLFEITRFLERQSERLGKSHEADVAERFHKQGPKEFAGLNLSRTARPSRTCLENLEGFEWLSPELERGSEMPRTSEVVALCGPIWFVIWSRPVPGCPDLRCERLLILWANWNMVLTKNLFAEVFGIPTEGLNNLLEIPKETVIEMRSLFSGYEEPFRSPYKKNGMKMEFRLLHDIVAKELCAKAGSFDVVTSKKFDFMVAITAGLKVNWGHILFQVLLSMVNNSKWQSQRCPAQVSVLLEKLVKIDLGDSVKIHPQKVLTNKSVQTYIKKNLEKPTGETSKKAEDTASNTDDDESQAAQLVEKEKDVNKTKKKKSTEAKPREKKKLPCPIPEVLAGGAEISGDEQVDDGTEGNERTDSDQDVQRGGDDRYEENLEYDTQMDHRGQNEVVSTTAQDAPRMSTDDVPKGKPLKFRTEQERATTQDQVENIVQQDIVNEAVTSQEHQAHENKTPVPTEEPRDVDNEHQAHGEQDNVQQPFLTKEHQQRCSTDNPTQVEDPSVNIEDTVNNPGIRPRAQHRVKPRK
ncbi:hypothetical protein F511_40585 [Dorcoceras hygrometricum]|uniref:Uncharacterized protein n=1 Tax=Dorcoceras hygrometricum TaxID=472368 RepID=A0A2Z7A8D5_9LAMI|nr:hypothetical protein F511_40585 [Dorcoceras hygrometricum]